MNWTDCHNTDERGPRLSVASAAGMRILVGCPDSTFLLSTDCGPFRASPLEAKTLETAKKEAEAKIADWLHEALSAVEK